MKATGMLRTWMTGVAAAVCATALAAEPTDADVKAQYVKAGRCYHAEDMDNNYVWAFRMAGSDTNRYARILRELAEEATNQTRNVMIDLRFYRTPESLPFLYAYSTNALYGADALKSIFAIEGVTSNSVAATGNYLSMTNFFILNSACDRTRLCRDLLRKVYEEQSLACYRTNVLCMALEYNSTANVTTPNGVDAEVCAIDPDYRYSQRRLAALRQYNSNITSYFNSLPETAESYNRRVSVFAFQTNYLNCAINELVAYPEANLPD